MQGTTPLEWVQTDAEDFAWSNITHTDNSGTVSLTAWASVQASGTPAKVVISAARAVEPSQLLANTSAWWAAYWPQAFVSPPVTRLEGFYYTEVSTPHHIVRSPACLSRAARVTDVSLRCVGSGDAAWANGEPGPDQQLQPVARRRVGHE